MSIQLTLRALSDPIRRQILESLKESNKSAGEIVELFDISGPAISRHLSLLKEAGLVNDYRKGKFIYYELKASVLEETMLWITNLKEQKDDRQVQNNFPVGTAERRDDGFLSDSAT